MNENPRFQIPPSGEPDQPKSTSDNELAAWRQVVLSAGMVPVRLEIDFVEEKLRHLPPEFPENVIGAELFDAGIGAYDDWVPGNPGLAYFSLSGGDKLEVALSVLKNRLDTLGILPLVSIYYANQHGDWTRYYPEEPTGFSISE